MTAPLVTAIVPTRDRRLRLAATLASLRSQTVPASELEIVVVDDGSTDGTGEAVKDLDQVTYLRQSQRGPATARNVGAEQARGKWLVFVDDDVELKPNVLRSMLDAHARRYRSVIVGRLDHPPPTSNFERLGLLAETHRPHAEQEIPFTKCFAGLLSIGRHDFLSLGGFRDPTGGWPSWDDVDFAYRASAAGFSLVCAGEARAIHHNHWAVSLDRLAQRELQAATTAVRLFQRYPGIQDAFRIYRDKLPVDVGRDGVLLAGRKIVRSLVSSQPMLAGIEGIATMLTARGVVWAARPVAECVVSGYQWRGIRAGLAAFGPLENRPPRAAS